MTDEENYLRIILSTDNHLGFAEKDPIRGNDSFITFEEILEISSAQSPDFLLLGGDLFHENKPSVSTLFKTTQLLRKHCWNNDPITFQIVSDQSSNFSHNLSFSYANFNDPNINVGLPVFTIHGNHDDPIDQSNLCALDLLHAAGLVNLFGKSSSIEQIVVEPILIRKGATKLALYGIGAVRNERLHRLFQQKKVTFLRPDQQDDKNDSVGDWFSILVFHQNRVKHGPTNFIPESFIPDFFDLVLWGHEHECRLVPEESSSHDYYICQPGSSVATALSDGESVEKFIGLLTINQMEFKIEKIKLQTIRPFVISSIILDEEEDAEELKKSRGKLERFCREKIEEMLVESERLKTNDSRQPELPLVRLVVDYSGGFEMISASRLSQEFVGRLANPREALLLHRRRETAARGTLGDRAGFISSGDRVEILDTTRVEDLVRQNFTRFGQTLAILSERRLAQGVRISIDKDSRNELATAVDARIKSVQVHLKQTRTNEDGVLKEIQRAIDFNLILDPGNEDDDENTSTGTSNNNANNNSIVVKAVSRPKSKRTKATAQIDNDDENEDEGNSNLEKVTKKRKTKANNNETSSLKTRRK